VKVKVGNVSIPIYPNGDGRFAVVFREAGQRIKHPYTTLAKAKIKAEEIAIRISNGQLDAEQFTAADREIFLHIQRTIEPFGMSAAVAIEEWAASKRLAASGPQRARIPLIVEQLIISKSDHKFSERYMRDLTWLREHLAKKFDCFIDELRQMQIENYLRELGVGDRRRNNIRDVIVTLFIFAKDHGYLPQDRDTAAEKIKRIDLEHEAPRIYTPAQLRVLLEHVAPEWIDWICCQAFAGIRPEEAALPHVSKKSGARRKLMWSDCMWDERQIRIVAQISKTNRDRYVTMNDTFIAWCGDHRGETGPVCKYDRPDRETGRLGELLGFDWINDGLRHSYASYWNSLHKDMARLKEEMGNSESVNRRFYYHPQPAAIAKKWWTTLPDDHLESAARRRKVVQMPLAIGFGHVP
jgi:integrase